MGRGFGVVCGGGERVVLLLCVSGGGAGSLFCGVILNIILSCAVILLSKRELIALL